ncbi:MAG: inorganic phosphate transporter [Bacteriovoracaceae bacterium]|nr:inorganic phosphate transporter [Bacteriovoracaceae bacterium]
MLAGLIAVILLTLFFEFINGFHDSANSIATIVSTKRLSPRKAVIFGTVFNIVGAFAGTHVAKTIGAGIVDSEIVTLTVIFCAIAGAISWNIFTWWVGIPSSSSHALIGGLMGAATAQSGLKVVHVHGVLEKVIIPMAISPALGIVMGFLIMLAILWICRRKIPSKVNRKVRRLQLLSSGFMALAHGSNDAQKSMGIITLALFSHGHLTSIDVPSWVIASCALCMGLGTMAGGWRIIRTMGTKMFKLRPVHGFAADTASASVILAASHFGIPVSTTHIIASSIMGVGSTKGISAVRWGIVGQIVQAWIFTVPICMGLSYFYYHLAHFVLHSINF